MATRPSRPIWKLPDAIASAVHRFDDFDRLKQIRYTFLAVTTTLLWLFSTPRAAAQLEELGNAVCGSGAGWIVNLFFIAGAVWLMFKGAGRGIKAIDDMGSSYENTREEGRQEAQGAVFTFGGGLVGVPFLAGLLYQVLPEQLSCIGFSFSFITVTPIEIVEPVMLLFGL